MDELINYVRENCILLYYCQYGLIDYSRKRFEARRSIITLFLFLFLLLNVHMAIFLSLNVQR